MIYKFVLIVRELKKKLNRIEEGKQIYVRYKIIFILIGAQSGGDLYVCFYFFFSSAAQQ